MTVESGKSRPGGNCINIMYFCNSSSPTMSELTSNLIMWSQLLTSLLFGGHWATCQAFSRPYFLIRTGENAFVRAWTFAGNTSAVVAEQLLCRRISTLFSMSCICESTRMFRVEFGFGRRNAAVTFRAFIKGRSIVAGLKLCIVWQAFCNFAVSCAN